LGLDLELPDSGKLSTPSSAIGTRLRASR